MGVQEECWVWVHEKVAFQGEEWRKMWAGVAEGEVVGGLGQGGGNEWQPRWVVPWKSPGKSWNKDHSVWVGSGLQRLQEAPFPRKNRLGEPPIPTPG